MEADHDQASVRGQQGERGLQPLLQGLKLGVDVNPKSLKRARCRVLARLAGLDCTSHERGKLPCAADGSPAFAASDKRLCNLKSKPFFAMLTNHLLDLALISRPGRAARPAPA